MVFGIGAFESVFCLLHFPIFLYTMGELIDYIFTCLFHTNVRIRFGFSMKMEEILSSESPLSCILGIMFSIRWA